MTLMREAWTRSVAGALEAHAVAVEQMAPGHWTFAPVAAAGLHVDARVEDDWLLFDAALPARLSRTLDCDWKAVAANAFLPGGLKLCTADGNSPLRLRAELPLSEDVPVAARVQQLCADIETATGLLTSGHGAAALDQRPAADGAAPDPDLQELCRETEWACTAREPNTVMVPLDVPGTFQQAVVEMDSARGMVVAVPVVAEAPRAGVCAAAVARLLLATTGAVRMARAAAGIAPAGVGFEVVFGHIPTAEELAHAFGALSVAWSCAGREAEVLARDERIARLYLGERDEGAVTQDATT